MTDMSLARNSPALCAVADFQFMGGIRVYYGNKGGYIQEMMYTNDDGWEGDNQFSPVDVQSGVGCTTQLDFQGNVTYVNLYFKNPDTEELQYWWNYFPLDPSEPDWENGNVYN